MKAIRLVASSLVLLPVIAVGAEPAVQAGRVEGQVVLRHHSEEHGTVSISGGDFGFETEQVSALQLGLGHHISDNVKVVIEYDIFDFDLTAGTEGDTSNRDMLLLDLAVRF
jgi:hypothetical protein